MKIAYWDSGLRWDDPNLRWGSPSYLLEPGDPGYVPPIPSVNQTKTKIKKMKHNNYYPIRLGDQLLWLENFLTVLPTVATALNLTPAQVAAIVADCRWQLYVLQIWLPAVRSWAASGTDVAAATQTGSGSTAQALPVFVAPALPTGVTAVNPGVLIRLFALVQQIKDGGLCTDDIATRLGIVGSVTSAPDLTTVQPVIAVYLSGSQVFVKWGWQGLGAWLDSCEIQVDRGDGKGFVLLTIDTTPNYTDTQALPANAAVWTYRAIYRAGETQTGIWSTPVSIAVKA